MSGGRPRYVVAGEALVDLVSEPAPASPLGVAVDPAPGAAGGPLLVARPGGSPYNTAVALARLGADVALVAGVGDDVLGSQLRRAAEASGVEGRWIRTGPTPTGLALAGAEPGATPAYQLYLDGTSALYVGESAPASDVFHCGSIASWHPRSHPTVRTMQRRARAGGALVTYDPNVRPGLGLAIEDVRTAVERCVTTAHLVKASEEDLAYLYPTDRTVDVARLWLSLGPAVVVVTLGSAGSAAYVDGGEIGRVPAIPVPVADTIGAGDAFTAGLLLALGDLDPARPGTMGAHRGEILAALGHASVVAALTCQRAGADPPTRAAVDEWYRSSRPAV